MIYIIWVNYFKFNYCQYFMYTISTMLASVLEKMLDGVTQATLLCGLHVAFGTANKNIRPIDPIRILGC